jgi:hypothetical protein
MWVASWQGNGITSVRGDECFDSEEDAMDRAAEVNAECGQVVTVWWRGDVEVAG